MWLASCGQTTGYKHLNSTNLNIFKQAKWSILPIQAPSPNVRRNLMGLESYLLLITFKEPVPITELKTLLLSCGAVQVDTTSETNFEIRENEGLVEIQVDSGNTVLVRHFFTRFSILSPHTVIDQAFEFLVKLLKVKKIKVYDTQLKMKEIPIDASEFKRNPKGVKKRQTIIDNMTGLVIAGGAATTEYIYKNNLEALYKSD